ncbi:MAG: alpha/beta hydrolase [Chloroflexi bacterium]|nr:alpha/beta hydrolase [Chloroflexota bacterium]
MTISQVENQTGDLTKGYAEVNGLKLYYEIHGAATQGNPPLVLLHGGLGMIELLGEALPQLAASRQVIAVDLQGHGRTADIDRPIRFERMADDIAALIRQLGFAQVDVMGYSLGGGAALRTAIQHPGLVRKLVLVSVTFKRTGSYPEVLAGMDQVGRAAAEFMKQSPIYQGYTRVAPKPENFPLLLDKVGDLLRQPYDWSNAVAALPMPVMLVFADADSVQASHMVEFFGLLGGGQRDAGWDGANMPKAQLAILPGLTHYNIFASPLLIPVVAPFLA